MCRDSCRVASSYRLVDELKCVWWFTSKIMLPYFLYSPNLTCKDTHRLQLPLPAVVNGPGHIMVSASEMFKLRPSNNECGRLRKESEFDGNYRGRCEKIRANAMVEFLVGS